MFSQTDWSHLCSVEMLLYLLFEGMKLLELSLLLFEDIQQNLLILMLLKLF